MRSIVLACTSPTFLLPDLMINGHLFREKAESATHLPPVAS